MNEFQFLSKSTIKSNILKAYMNILKINTGITRILEQQKESIVVVHVDYVKKNMNLK